MDKMEIYLVRHGRTKGNSENRYVGGGTDEPLSPEGEALALGLGAHPEIANIYVSPMRRTRQTATLLFPNAEQTVMEDLREMHFGVFENRTADEMDQDEIYRSWVDGNCEGVCPGGESVWQVIDRARTALMQCVEDAKRRGERRVVAVTHGGVIMSLMYDMAEPKQDYYDWFVDNCGGYRAELADTEDGPVLVNWRHFDGPEF